MTIEKNSESSGSNPDEGVNPASPADEEVTPAEQEESQASGDVEASSSEIDQADKPSLLDEIEQAMVEETGKPLEDKPEVKPKEEEPTKSEKEEEPETEEDKAKKLHEVPEGVKEGSKAHTRFQELVSNNKQLTQEKEQAVGQLESMRTLISETGVSREEFSDILDYAREAKRGDPKKALEMLDVQRKNLLLQIGENVEPPDILSDFPDLQTKVTDGELAVDDAIKLAKSHIQETRQQREKEEADKVSQDQQAYETQVVENRDKVIALEKSWMANDLDWSVKRDLLAAKMPDINKRPPHEWPQLVEDAYKLITETIKVAVPAGKKLTPDSPVRKGGADGNGQPEPKSLYEAIAQENNWE